MDPDQASDRLSARYLVALAGRVVREVGELVAARRAPRASGCPTMAHRHRDPLPVGRGPRRVRRRAHRGRARPRRPLPPRRRAAPPARRRRPPQTRGARHDNPRRPPSPRARRSSCPARPSRSGTPSPPANGISSWFMPTDVEERVGGAVAFHMGDDMLAGHDHRLGPAAPLRLRGAGLGGARRPRRRRRSRRWSPSSSSRPAPAARASLRVVSSAFGTGADWEQEFFDGDGEGLDAVLRQPPPLPRPLPRSAVTTLAGRRAGPRRRRRGAGRGARRARRRATVGERSTPDGARRRSSASATTPTDCCCASTDPVPGYIGMSAYDMGDGTTIAAVDGLPLLGRRAGVRRTGALGWKAWLERPGRARADHVDLRARDESAAPSVSTRHATQHEVHAVTRPGHRDQRPRQGLRRDPRRRRHRPRRARRHRVRRARARTAPARRPRSACSRRCCDPTAARRACSATTSSPRPTPCAAAVSLTGSSRRSTRS